MADSETYLAPAYGWTCFHCGEHFLPTGDGIAAARVHFGVTPDYQPGCVERLTVSAAALRARVIAAETEALDAADRAIWAHDRAEQFEFVASLAHDVAPLRDKLETAVGRAISAEVMLAAIEHIAGTGLIAWARAIACGDPAPPLQGSFLVSAAYRSAEIEAVLCQIDRSRATTGKPQPVAPAALVIS